jgi:hypothetical protein
MTGVPKRDMIARGYGKRPMIEEYCHCGKVHWRFDGEPDGATACNCTVCRRYGALWIYGFEGENVALTGATKAYSWGEHNLGFHFCPECGCVAAWRGIKPRPDGRRRMGVNVRLADPKAVGAIPIDHFDGLESWKRLERDGRTVAHMWF